jgi:hypothetical protein
VDEPRSFGQQFDVGSHDVLTIDQMIDPGADRRGRRHPVKIHLPRRLLARLAPVVERAARMPPGAIGGFVGEGTDADMIGDASGIRRLTERPPQPFEEAMALALAEGTAPQGQDDRRVSTSAARPYGIL